MHRQVQLNSVLAVQDEVGDGASFGLRERLGARISVVTRVVGRASLTPVEAPVAVQVHTWTLFRQISVGAVGKENISDLLVFGFTYTF